jgi:ABC-type antimicrobial peptide transport system permease subunit
MVALAEDKTLASHVRDLTAAQRMSAIATMTLALLGVVMLAAGCVSLFVSMVRDSVREIAIRMALGATTGRLTRRVLTQGMVVTLTGMMVGLVAARAVAVRIADRLHGVSAWDPFTWMAALALIALVSLTSVYAAAVLAARTDPARLLRTE